MFDDERKVYHKEERKGPMTFFEDRNPHDTRHMPLLVRIFRWVVLAFIVFILAGSAMLIWVSVARAQMEDHSLPENHGHKDFWMAKPYYQQLIHNLGCCGPEDCKPADEIGATITETEDGFIVRDPRAAEGHREQFFSKADDYSPPNNPIKGKKGLYFTEDPNNRPYVCVYGQRIVCVAVKRKEQI